jgi:hypothetical protein
MCQNLSQNHQFFALLLCTLMDDAMNDLDRRLSEFFGKPGVK